MKIRISNIDGYFYEDTENVIYITADGSYSIFFLNDGRRIVASYSLGKIQLVLKDYHFIRINRSVIINILMISYIDKNTLSCYLKIGENKLKLSISKSAFETFKLKELA